MRSSPCKKVTASSSTSLAARTIASRCSAVTEYSIVGRSFLATPPMSCHENGLLACHAERREASGEPTGRRGPRGCFALAQHVMGERLFTGMIRLVLIIQVHHSYLHRRDEVDDDGDDAEDQRKTEGERVVAVKAQLPAFA